MSEPTARTISAEDLQRWSATVLKRFDVSDEDASIATTALVRTSLRGIDTHGIARLPAYVERLASGEFDPRAVPQLREQHGLLRCDGDD